MNEIALRFILLPEYAIYFVNFAVLVFGAFLAWLTAGNGEWCIRRLYYFLSTALVLLGVMVVQLYWLQIPDALEDGFLGRIFVINVLVLLIAGYLIWLIAAARSRDISGTNANAALAFIPIANLYLLCAKGTNYSHTLERPWFFRFIFDPIIFFVALFAYASTNTLAKFAAGSIEDQSKLNLSDASLERISGSLGLNQTLKLAVEEMQGSAPIQVDEITQITEVSTTSSTITLTYLVDTDITSFRLSFSDALIQKACSPGGFGPIFALDGHIVHHYINRNGHIILHLEISASDCI